MKRNYKHLLLALKKQLNLILKKDNDNVIFERVTKVTNINGILFDGIFLLMFFLAPIILASIGDLASISNNTTLYIVNFTLLAVIYPIGLIIYWWHDHVSLIRNGGIGFFIAVILMNLLLPIVQLILDKTIDDLNLVRTISIIIQDLTKVLIIIILLKLAYPLRLDIKEAIYKRFLLIILIAIICAGLYFAVNPLFELINLELNRSTGELPKQVSLFNKDVIGGTFFSYWRIIFTIVVAPLFYSLVYRHSIMVLMKTDLMKFMMPTLYFIVVFLINKQIEQDTTYFFYFLCWSIILTTIMYIKRNVTYSICTSNLINLINIIRLVA